MSSGAKKITLAISVFLAVLVGALFAAEYVRSDAGLQMLVAQFGYLGIVVLAIIAGLNALVPVPAATFTPIFVAAGLELPFIVIALVIGTAIADFTGYFIGRFSRDFVLEHYPRTFAVVESLVTKHELWVVPVVALYAALAPFPNEAILIPLALAGVSIRTLIIPIIIGNVVHQALLVYGVANIFAYFF